MTAVDLNPATGAERVDPLVVAIGELDDVVTVDTCEGGPGRDASVSFRCRHGDGARLARELADLLAEHERDIACELQATWRPGAGASDPVIRLACPGEHVIPLALMLRASGRSRRDGRLGAARTKSRPARHLHAVRAG
jgi:hypothetical protein